MTAKELRFMQALGEVDVKFVEKAAPWKCRSAGKPTAGTVGSGWWSGAKYVIGGLAAAAVLITGAVLLHNALRDTPVPYQPGDSAVLTEAPENGTRVIATSEKPLELFPEPLIDRYADQNPDPFDLTGPTDMPDHYMNMYKENFTTLSTNLTDLVDQDELKAWREQYRKQAQEYGAYAEQITVYAFLRDFGISDAQLRATNEYPQWINDDDIEIIYSGDEDLIKRTYKDDWAILHEGRIYTPRWLFEYSIQEYENRGLPKDEVARTAAKMQSLPFTAEAWQHFKDKVEQYIGRPLAADQDLGWQTVDIDGVFARFSTTMHANPDDGSVSIERTPVELCRFGEGTIGTDLCRSPLGSEGDSAITYPDDKELEFQLRAGSDGCYLVILAIPWEMGGIYRGKACTLYWYDGTTFYMIDGLYPDVTSADDINIGTDNTITVNNVDGTISLYSVYKQDPGFGHKEVGNMSPKATFRVNVIPSGIIEDTFELPQVFCDGANEAYTQVYASEITGFRSDDLLTELGTTYEFADPGHVYETLKKYCDEDGTPDTAKMESELPAADLYYLWSDTVAAKCLRLGNGWLISFAGERNVAALHLDAVNDNRCRFCSKIRRDIVLLWKMKADRPDELSGLCADILYNSENKAYAGLRIFVGEGYESVVEAALKAYGSTGGIIRDIITIPEGTVLTR